MELTLIRMAAREEQEAGGGREAGNGRCQARGDSSRAKQTEHGHTGYLEDRLSSVFFIY